MEKNHQKRMGWNQADVSIHTPRTEQDAALRREQIGGVIPLFFATDNNYLPFLAITLQSIKENSSRAYEYKIYVLHSGIKEEYKEKILHFSEDNFRIKFVDVTERLKDISSKLHMRPISVFLSRVCSPNTTKRCIWIAIR